MPASLTVKYEISETDQTLKGYALRVTVTAATGISPAIFIFHRSITPTLYSGENVLDEFVSIADPIDLNEIPEEEPDLENEMPYYRLPSVTLYFRNPIDLHNTKQIIEYDIKSLINSYNTISQFVQSEEVTY